MSVFHSIIAQLDRATIPSHRWDRLERRLRAEGLDEPATRRLVRDELRYQEHAFGAALRVPMWARGLVGEKGHEVGALGPAGKVREADLEALRRLVIHLDRHRGERFSIVARRWAVGGPGEDWADDALRRLATAGILAKRRGSGRANAPAWRFDLPLSEAVTRLPRTPPPAKR